MTNQLSPSSTHLFHALRIGVIALSSTLSLALFSSQAQAQTKEEVFEAYFKDWYQIEMIIFKRSESQSDDNESWPKNITLSYPSNLKFLMSAETLKEREAELAKENTGDTLNPDDSIKNRRLLQQLRQGGSNDPYYQKLISSLEKSEIDRLSPQEVPFVELDPEIRALNDDAKRIDRNRSMAVLFHQAWRQPIGDKSNMTAIVINSGEQFDQHFELEGSVSFYVSRYLHAYTNLWLSEFEANFGQESQHWPLLPPPPWATQPFDDLAINDVGITAIDGKTSGNSTSLQNWDITLKKENDFNFNNSNSNSLFENYDDLTAKPFVQKNLVSMRQKRRMRSGELHYVDHPKLGIILRIDKYQPKAE